MHPFKYDGMNTMKHTHVLGIVPSSVILCQRTSVVFMYSSALLSSDKMESQHYN